MPRSVRTSKRWSVVLGITVIVPFVAYATGASATTLPKLAFTVNSTVDAPAANPGSAVCADSAGQCTLRAAIQVSDAQPAGTVTNVTVPAGTYILSLGPLLVTANILIVTGAGSSHTIIENAKKASNQLIGVSTKTTATFGFV